MIKNNYISYAIIIQARLASTRFKNKILKKIDKNVTILDLLILRLLKKFKKDKIIFALAKDSKNYKIKNILIKYGLKYYEGSEKNVLKRYFDCAKKFHIKNIIRITSDCPLIDPFLIDKMYRYFKYKNLDYLSNTLPEKDKKFPDGSDIEIFTFDAFKRMYRMKLSNDDKEHVTNKFWSLSIFRKKIYDSKKNFSKYRYTIDYKTDILIIKYLFNKLKKLKKFGTTGELVHMIDNNKKIKKIMMLNILKQRIRRKKIFYK